MGSKKPAKMNGLIWIGKKPADSAKRVHPVPLSLTVKNRLKKRGLAFLIA